MIIALHDLAGLALVLAAWLLPRRIAGAGGSRLAALALDAAPLVATALLMFLASGKPILAGLIDLALGAGFALADSTTRATLQEPVLFSALSELPQIFTHPRLYLPFAGTGLVLGGAAAVTGLAVALFAVEPTTIAPHPLLALIAAGAVAAGIAAVAREPALGAAARGLRRLRPSGEPFADAATLGPAAMLVAHGIIARSERPARRAALAPQDTAETAAAPRPIILVQCESFFDARRLLPMLPRDFLAGYDRACGSGEQFGRLAVPAWGANTMRAEFAVLTGIGEAALGLDRFNPYHALARTPIASQVWRLRRAGYRTICLHPFDRRFFRRDLAMPALGFEEFLGRETLGGSRAPPYAPDPDLAGPILRVLDESGPRVFIFAITMGNHGPWFAEGPPIDPGLARLFEPGIVPQAGELSRYLDGLARSDELLQRLMAGLERRKSAALLAWYGDHLPSLPQALRHFGATDWHSDYAVWSAGGGLARWRDLAAWELGCLVADAVLRPREATVAAAAVVPASIGA